MENHCEVERGEAREQRGRYSANNRSKDTRYSESIQSYRAQRRVNKQHACSFVTDLDQSIELELKASQFKRKTFHFSTKRILIHFLFFICTNYHDTVSNVTADMFFLTFVL